MLLLHNKTTGEYLLFSDNYETIDIATDILGIDQYHVVDVVNYRGESEQIQEFDEAEVSNNK